MQARCNHNSILHLCPLPKVDPSDEGHGQGDFLGPKAPGRRSSTPRLPTFTPVAPRLMIYVTNAYDFLNTYLAQR